MKSGSGSRFLKEPTISNAPAPAGTILACVEVLKIHKEERKLQVNIKVSIFYGAYLSNLVNWENQYGFCIHKYA